MIQSNVATRSTTRPRKLVLVATALILAAACCAAALAFAKPGAAQAAPTNCVTFTGTGPFTLTVGSGDQYEGTLEYSTDGETWTAVTKGAAIASGVSNAIYMRGTGNTVITGGGYNHANVWQLSAAEGITVAASGNIMTLLDYEAVGRGEMPTMGLFAFCSMFYDCEALTGAPSLPATSLTSSCYNNMFYNCTALATAPALPATNLTDNCYTQMFYDCKALTAAPALPATNLAVGCYYNMFSGCKSLTKLPELKATTLPENCYSQMFYGCSGITLYAGGVGDSWSLPSGAMGTNWGSGMLGGTAGTQTETPVPGTTYYYTAYPTDLITQQPTPENGYKVEVDTSSLRPEHTLSYQWYQRKEEAAYMNETETSCGRLVTGTWNGDVASSAEQRGSQTIVLMGVSPSNTYIAEMSDESYGKLDASSQAKLTSLGNQQYTCALALGKGFYLSLTGTDSFSAKFLVKSAKDTAVEGQTTDTLTKGVDGSNYYCRVTVATFEDHPMDSDVVPYVTPTQPQPQSDKYFPATGDNRGRILLAVVAVVVVAGVVLLIVALRNRKSL